jgi:predicted DNA-binding protein (MmcQ/YjbR family)
MGINQFHKFGLLRFETNYRKKTKMNVEEIREYCLLKPAVEEGFPFDQTTLVFKVGGKMFLLMSLDSNPITFNAKCKPDKAIELREKFHCVQPGYHMSKVHWNTITCNGSVPKKMIFSWIDDSYELIVASLPKKIQERLK